MGNRIKTIEESEVMKMTISEIYDNADMVTSDRRRNMLSLQYYNNGYSITVEIKKTDDIMEKLETRDDIPELDKEVLQRLASGQKQVEVAERLKISQAKVSGIKKSYENVLAALSSFASATDVVSTVISDMKKK